MLLNLKDILNEFILENLKSFSLLHDNLQFDNIEDISEEAVEFSETRLLRLSLYILNAFCEFPTLNGNKMEWNSDTMSIAYSNRSDLPAVLYISPEEFARHLTMILALRNRNDKYLNVYGLRLQDWELVIQYLEVFTTILQYGLIVQPETFVNMFQFFNTLSNEYGSITTKKKSYIDINETIV